MKLHKCPLCLDFHGSSYDVYMHFRGDHWMSEEVSLSLWWAVIAAGYRSSAQQSELQASQESRPSLGHSTRTRFRFRERSRLSRSRAAFDPLLPN